MVGETFAMAPDVFLRELWYMPALASSLRPGDMRREMLLGEPVVLGRMKDGALFALRDICPHRGVPLSAGRIRHENGAEGSVECPYHGWRFKRDGQCSKIPSLTGEESLDIEKIKVRSYPVREQDGLIWVYMAAKPGGAPKTEPPRAGSSH
ncbi:MAG TPA: Rieske (2Fe-2S) protein, partial [Rhizomicrobium sp.]|nr:Rieske (2Fe-2S) protein [Rhizomicrobium sp.]